MKPAIAMGLVLLAGVGCGYDDEFGAALALADHCGVASVVPDVDRSHRSGSHPGSEIEPVPLDALEKTPNFLSTLRLEDALERGLALHAPPARDGRMSVVLMRFVSEAVIEALVEVPRDAWAYEDFGEGVKHPDGRFGVGRIRFDAARLASFRGKDYMACAAYDSTQLATTEESVTKLSEPAEVADGHYAISAGAFVSPREATLLNPGFVLDIVPARAATLSVYIKQSDVWELLDPDCYSYKAPVTFKTVLADGRTVYSGVNLVSPTLGWGLPFLRFLRPLCQTVTGSDVVHGAPLLATFTIAPL